MIGSFTPSIAVVAGRRIDAPGSANKLFPKSEESRVYQELQEHFRSRQIHEIVCSAACGTDILALEAAQALGLGRTIFLPSAAASFRKSSVVDRGGDWGPRFDRIIDEASCSGSLVVVSDTGEDNDHYLKVNAAMLAFAQSSKWHRRFAVVAWDGKPRQDTDVTEAFLVRAVKLGFTADVIVTIPEET